MTINFTINLFLKFLNIPGNLKFKMSMKNYLSAVRSDNKLKLDEKISEQWAKTNKTSSWRLRRKCWRCSSTKTKKIK